MSTTLSPEAKQALIQRLTDHVVSECSAIDMESRFRELLDELYTFDNVGGPFAHMQPSRVLEEMDPVAFRCGVSDMDTSEMNEVRGDWYDSREVDAARDGFIDKLRAELAEAETALDDAAEEQDVDTGHASLAPDRGRIEVIEAQIDEVERYAF